MKYCLSALIAFSLLSCSNDNIVISKKEYAKLTGDTIKSKYPKTVMVPNQKEYTEKSFEVYHGSDSHEYVLHHEYHIDDQWTHYGGCELCKSRYDTILFYIKHQ